MLTLYVFFDRIFQVNLSGIKSEALRTELLSTKDLKNVLLEDGSQPYMGNMVSLRKFTKNFRQSEFISLQKKLELSLLKVQNMFERLFTPGLCFMVRHIAHLSYIYMYKVFTNWADFG